MADETCRTYGVDGEPVVVRGNREFDEQDRAALAELVRAAKRKLAREEPTPERCETTDLLVDQCACPQHRGGFTPQEEANTLPDVSGRWHSARYRGRCAECGEPFEAGTRIRARQHQGGSHWIAECCTKEDW